MTQHKKVVIISPAYPYRGGQALVESYLNVGIGQLGIDCHTVSFTKLYPEIFFPGTTQYEESKDIFNPHSEKIYRIINSINPITWIKAYRKIKSLQPQVVLFIWWMPFFAPCYSFICILLRLFTKTKIMFMVENYISHENRWIENYLNRFTLQFAHEYICQSTFVKQSLERNHKNKKISQTTLSLYDHYDKKRFSSQEARKFLEIETKYVVLFFGLIRAYKGLDNLLKAIPFIPKEFESLTLLVAGECYEESSTYTNLIQELNIENKVKLKLQFISNEDVEPYFKAADVVCLPYNRATQSGILMMAYGFRKPVLVNNVGGLPELVKEGKTGLVMPNNKPETIAEYISRVLRMYADTNIEANINDVNTNLGYQTLNEIFL